MFRFFVQEQRKHYQVEIYNGKLFYEQTGELVHTGNSDNLDERWIFVMSPYGRLYVGKVHIHSAIHYTSIPLVFVSKMYLRTLGQLQ